MGIFTVCHNIVNNYRSLHIEQTRNVERLEVWVPLS